MKAKTRTPDITSYASINMALLLTASLFSVTASAQATQSTDSHFVNDFKNYAATLTESSPLEGAGSHGSIGVGLGLGLSRHQTPSNNKLVEEQLQPREDFNSKSRPNNETQDYTSIRRFYFYKGLPWPIDLGGSIGSIIGTSATTASGYAQWTMYEAFQMPAFALRAKHARLMGLPSAEVQSSTLEAVASLGLLRIFNIYGSMAVSKGDITIRTRGESATSLTLSSIDHPTYTTTTDSTTRALGFQVQIMPQFLIATIEARSSSSQNSYLGKISLGL
jgi:hypothetical protein